MSSKRSSPHGGLTDSSVNNPSAKKANPALSPRVSGRKAKELAKSGLVGKGTSESPKSKRSVS